MAKLYSNQLSASLQKQLASIYLISGDETLLVDETVHSIRAQARTLGFSERQRFDITTHFDWSSVEESLASLSLFSDKKIIELYLTNKLNDKGRKIIKDYIGKPSEDIVLLLVSPKLDASASRSAWVKQITDKGHWLPIWPLNPSQLSRYLQQRLAKSKLTIEPEALSLLIERTEGNLLASAQEIDKLALLVERNTHVDAELLMAQVADNARYNVFDLMDKMLAGQSRSSLRSLKGMAAEGSEPTLILWAITKEIRLLINIHHSVSRGEALAKVYDKQRVWKQRQTLVKTALARIDLTTATQALAKACAIDHSIKGLGFSNVWDQLKELVLLLSGKPSLSPIA